MNTDNMQRNGKTALLLCMNDMIVSAHAWLRLNGTKHKRYQKSRKKSICVTDFAHAGLSKNCYRYEWYQNHPSKNLNV